MVSRRTRTVQTASHWGVYRVEVDTETDEVISVRPDGRDPEPSPIHASLPQTVRDSLRIDRPYVREGYLRARGASRADRGRDGFVPLDWDTALDLICEALTQARDDHGNASIYGGSYGWASAGRFHHAPSTLKRFLTLFGGYTDKSGNHSFGAAQGMMPYVIGSADIGALVTRWPELVDNTRLLVMFGGAALKNTQVDPGGIVTHQSRGWMRQIRAAGIEVVSISPQRGDIPTDTAPEWIPIRPNTDVAMMLALAHTLVVDDLADHEFLDRLCVGYPELENYLLGREDGTPKDPRWAAAITGAPADTIVALAHRMAATRTLINTAWAVQRAHHGEQPVWATVALASLLGQIGLPGGGFNLGFGAVGGNAVPRANDIPRPTLPIGTNPVDTRIPAGRLTDLFLRPGQTLEHNGKTITLPVTEVVYSAGGNPFHHNLNLNRFLAGWQRPGTIVIHEPWWTPTARFADIVIPSTTTLERNDIAAAEHSCFWTTMHQAMAPFAHSRHDFDVFSDLADRLGIGPQYHGNRTEMQWLEHLYDTARTTALQCGYDPPDFATFWNEGSYEFPEQHAHPVLFSAFRHAPRSHPLATDSGRIELVSERIRSYGYVDCPAHPSWLEPAEWLGSPRTNQYPLHLLTNQPRHRLHSQLDQSTVSRAGKVHGREAILMTDGDAAARGLRAGDVVTVFNDRGAFLAGVRIAAPDTLFERVVQVPTGAWYDPLDPGTVGSLDKHGNPNVVTLDCATSRLTQCSSAQTCLVEVQRCDDPPPVTAFARPPGTNPAPNHAQPRRDPGNDEEEQMASTDKTADQWDIATSVGMTALGAAAARALETTSATGLVRDHLATRFVTAANAPADFPTHRDHPRATRNIWRAMTDLLGVRSRFLDDLVQDAVRGGITQVVVLAAGLDVRAYRLPCLHTCDVYEIDQPRVLAFKDNVTTAMGAHSRCRRHPVPVDLRDDWTYPLGAAGHDPTRPTVWLAEGLLPYLSAHTETLLLDTVTALSAPASRLGAELIHDIDRLLDSPLLTTSDTEYGTDLRALWNNEPRPPADQALHERGWTGTAQPLQHLADTFGRTLTPATADLIGRHIQLLAAHSKT